MTDKPGISAARKLEGNSPLQVPEPAEIAAARKAAAPSPLDVLASVVVVPTTAPPEPRVYPPRMTLGCAPWEHPLPLPGERRTRSPDMPLTPDDRARIRAFAQAGGKTPRSTAEIRDDIDGRQLVLVLLDECGQAKADAIAATEWWLNDRVVDTPETNEVLRRIMLYSRERDAEIAALKAAVR
jgi:hypothetical protein